MTAFEGVNGNVKVLLRATKNGELQTIARIESALEHASADGESFAFPSLDTDIAAGATRLFVKNTGEKFLILSHAEFNPSNVVCKWDVGIGSETTTPSGSSVTGINMNQTQSSKTEDFVAFDNEINVADATKMFQVTTSTVNSKEVSLRGIVLGKNHYIQINQETESTSGQVTVFGLFADELI